MLKYDVMVFEGDSMLAALTDHGTCVIPIRGLNPSDTVDLSDMLCKYGVKCYIVPHWEE